GRRFARLTALAVTRRFQPREVLFAELVRPPLGPRLLLRTELDAADLPGDRLRELRELDPADTLVWSELLASVAKDREGRLRVWLVAGGEGDVRLRDGEPDRVRRRNDRRLGDGWMLDQDALELERRDPVVGGLEDVVGAADVGDVAVLVAPGDVACVV